MMKMVCLFTTNRGISQQRRNAGPVTTAQTPKEKQSEEEAFMRSGACLLGPISFRKNRFLLNRAMCRHLIREFFLKTV